MALLKIGSNYKVFLKHTIKIGRPHFSAVILLRIALRNAFVLPSLLSDV